MGGYAQTGLSSKTAEENVVCEGLLGENNKTFGDMQDELRLITEVLQTTGVNPADIDPEKICTTLHRTNGNVDDALAVRERAQDLLLSSSDPHEPRLEHTTGKAHAPSTASASMWVENEAALAQVLAKSADEHRRQQEENEFLTQVLAKSADEHRRQQEDKDETLAQAFAESTGIHSRQEEEEDALAQALAKSTDEHRRREEEEDALAQALAKSIDEHRRREEETLDVKQQLTTLEDEVCHLSAEQANLAAERSHLDEIQLQMAIIISQIEACESDDERAGGCSREVPTQTRPQEQQASISELEGELESQPVENSQVLPELKQHKQIMMMDVKEGHVEAQREGLLWEEELNKCISKQEQHNCLRKEEHVSVDAECRQLQQQLEHDHQQSLDLEPASRDDAGTAVPTQTRPHEQQASISELEGELESQPVENSQVLPELKQHKQITMMDVKESHVEYKAEREGLLWEEELNNCIRDDAGTAERIASLEAQVATERQVLSKVQTSQVKLITSLKQKHAEGIQRLKSNLDSANTIKHATCKKAKELAKELAAKRAEYNAQEERLRKLESKVQAAESNHRFAADAWNSEREELKNDLQKAQDEVTLVKKELLAAKSAVHVVGKARGAEAFAEVQVNTNDSQKPTGDDKPNHRDQVFVPHVPSTSQQHLFTVYDPSLPGGLL